ncbi:hypothetical protein ACSBR2_017305 [Camellia fascicularis]
MTALVTGGTCGIRHAIVEKLVGLGAKVHTYARNETKLKRCLRDWEDERFGVTGSVCDVSSCPARGANGLCLLCLQWQAQHSQAPGVGSVVFTSSVSGFVSLKCMSVHRATKGVINQLTRNLACERPKDNIKSNAVAPWYIKTSMVE